MGGRQQKARLFAVLPDPEGDPAGAVPQGIIRPALLKLPAAAFLKFLKTCCLKFPADRFRRVKCRRAFPEKFLQSAQLFIFCINSCCLCHVCSSSLKGTCKSKCTCPFIRNGLRHASSSGSCIGKAAGCSCLSQRAPAIPGLPVPLSVRCLLSGAPLVLRRIRPLRSALRRFRSL